MKHRAFARSILVLSFASLAVPPATYAQAPATPANAATAAPTVVFKQEELEQLVAPIALYPDALIAQILMASTYPLEVVQAARWSKANPKVKEKALEDAMQQQRWDESVKSLTAFPQVLEMMNEKLDFTQKLGDAFLAQEKEVLAAIQRLRAKADQAGNLKSGKEQTVSKAEEGGQTVIKIEPADPQTLYVPAYDPMWVYGPWPYVAYPPYYYYPPYYAPGAALFTFAVGVAIGHALWGGCNWGGGGVYINHHTYNNFNRSNIQGGNWQHRPEHRKGVGYRDQGSQQRFGGGQRPGVDTREQFRGRQDAGRGAGDRSAGRGGPSASTRDAGGFSGIGSGSQTRDFSSRGASSRASSASSFGGGGARGGGGGGGRGGGGGGRR